MSRTAPRQNTTAEGALAPKPEPLSKSRNGTASVSCNRITTLLGGHLLKASLIAPHNLPDPLPPSTWHCAAPFLILFSELRYAFQTSSSWSRVVDFKRQGMLLFNPFVRRNSNEQRVCKKLRSSLLPRSANCDSFASDDIACILRHGCDSHDAPGSWEPVIARRQHRTRLRSVGTSLVVSCGCIWSSDPSSARRKVQPPRAAFFPASSASSERDGQSAAAVMRAKASRRPHHMVLSSFGRNCSGSASPSQKSKNDTVWWSIAILEVPPQT
mmetsp:Transcript_94927/g.268081  ORF Transcript_94927/g.268081 Transcript_94927/m.268081 type:complete len:270 (+) Transcript_94927:1205-2014(+)